MAWNPSRLPSSLRPGRMERLAWFAYAPWYIERLFCRPKRAFLAILPIMVNGRAIGSTTRVLGAVTLCALRPIDTIFPSPFPTVALRDKASLQHRNAEITARVNHVADLWGANEQGKASHTGRMGGRQE